MGCTHSKHDQIAGYKLLAELFEEMAESDRQREAAVGRMLEINERLEKGEEISDNDRAWLLLELERTKFEEEKRQRQRQEAFNMLVNLQWQSFKETEPEWTKATTPMPLPGRKSIPSRLPTETENIVEKIREKIVQQEDEVKQRIEEEVKRREEALEMQRRRDSDPEGRPPTPPDPSSVEPLEDNIKQEDATQPLPEDGAHIQDAAGRSNDGEPKEEPTTDEEGAKQSREDEISEDNEIIIRNLLDREIQGNQLIARCNELATRLQEAASGEAPKQP